MPVDTNRYSIKNEVKMEKAKIIVVDDEPDILEIYETILGESYSVTSYNDPNIFLKALEAKTIKDFNLLISDLKMPAMSGIDMIKKAQDLGFHFPFVLLSGYLNKESAIEAVDLGVYRLLEKPTDFAILLSVIDQLLLEHEAEEVRKEIRNITSQLRELYTSIRFVLSNHLPQEVIDRLVIDTDSDGTVKEKMSFDSLLEKLETRLDRLLESEKMMSELKTRKT